MPHCDKLYIAQYLFEIGATAGDNPIPHSEILAWKINTGIELDSWEASVIKNLSLEYLAESRAATQAGAPAPWTDAPYLQSVKQDAASRLKAYIERMAA